MLWYGFCYYCVVLSTKGDCLPVWIHDRVEFMMKASTLNCHMFGTGLEDFEERVISPTFGAKIQIYMT